MEEWTEEREEGRTRQEAEERKKTTIKISSQEKNPKWDTNYVLNFSLYVEQEPV